MSQLLYIESSPRKDRAASIEVARHFVGAYQAQHPQDTITTLDLWATELPRFDAATIDAKYAILHGQPHTEEQRRAWAAVESICRQFTGADKYVFSVPMWNFSIPYILKHYIDVLVQPGQTFTFSPETGYRGLVTGKPALVVYARGGAYGAGTGAEGYDQQSRYVQQILGFIGFTDVKSIFIEPTLGGPGPKDQAIAAALRQADELVKTF